MKSLLDILGKQRVYQMTEGSNVGGGADGGEEQEEGGAERGGSPPPPPPPPPPVCVLEGPSAEEEN